MSVFSDIESMASLCDRKLPDDPVITGNPKSAPVHPEFAFTDANIEIQTTDQTFWVHEYHINKFSVFATLIKTTQRQDALSETRHRLVLTCGQKIKGIEMYNTLKVIYASHIDGVPNFDPNTLICALRVASTFDYPDLRKFAITKLEGVDLPAIQRIQLSDEFFLPAWETPAFTELCNRREPVSPAEAEVLGIARLVDIARIREMERTRWAVGFVKDVNDSLQQPDEPNSQDSPEYSSRLSAFLACNCTVKVGNLGGKPPVPHTVIHCDFHKFAPKFLEEGKQLLEQRNELNQRLRNIRSTTQTRFDKAMFSFKLDAPDLDTELTNASWIRREGVTAP